MPIPCRRSLAILLLLAAPAAARAQAVPIKINATPIQRFLPTGSNRIGPLEFRGGLVLASPAREFGGLSGLVLDADGQGLVAVTDRGFWLTGRIEAEGDRPTGIRAAFMAPLRADGGGELRQQGRGDIESLARLPGGFLVGIEHAQEVWSFSGDDPLHATGRRLLADPQLARLGGNESLEALLAPPPGTPGAPAPLIVIAEESPSDPAVLPGFLFGPLDRPAPLGAFAVERIDGFSATDAALSDDGRVYLLERRFDMLRGVFMRIRRFPLADIRPGALIRGEVLIEASGTAAIDNMEGIALHRNAAGELILTLLSDDNFSPLQRTLLLRFAVMP
ncbi:hypothetical protein FHS55_001456 [Angulomicrobium tetraedrale]|uniref:Phytase-like domain-containing protein n=1 Tax=Ancylobacter tetraedralis TaxID=217068 RepID=A0A839Z744_9HYPH|nr:esterase-like activity of phytase family protein [Ancylobacter tetraedralis]MBB3770861.1 hypothetical protein [Ancylobacter tetraedralis]